MEFHCNGSLTRRTSGEGDRFFVTDRYRLIRDDRANVPNWGEAG